MKRIHLSAENARILLDAYDEWKGSMHPDVQEEYLARFDGLRKRLAELEAETNSK